jgi:hypothetical protein
MEKTITAKEIHADFYGAEERLYVEAIGLSKGTLVKNSSKADRLKKIGFGNAKPIKDDIELEKKRSVSGHMIHCIEYFRTYYPQNKFITEAEVKILCEKYGLLLGDASSYIGDMPEKNLQDIEQFKLRKEDWKEKSSSPWFSWADSPSPQAGLINLFRPSSQAADEYGTYLTKPRQSGRTRLYDDLLANYMMAKDEMAMQLGISQSRQGVIGVDPYRKEDKPEPKKEYEQPAFKICAPKEDFNTRGYEIRDGYRLVYDPIVLQSVSKDGINGYLLVTAWGDEATDDVVKNPASN